MRMLTYIFVSIFLFMHVSCEKKTEEPGPIDPNPPQNNQLEVVWRQNLLPTGQESASMSPVLWENRVLYTAYGDYNGQQTPLLFLDTATGETKKVMNLGGSPTFFNWEKQQQKGHLLFLNQRDHIDCINLNTQSILWQQSFVKDGSSQCYIIDNYVYRTVRFNGSLPNLSASVMRSPLYQSNWETIYTFTSDNNYSVGFDCVAGTHLSNGDNLILFKSGHWNFDESRGRMDLFCYNMSADSLYWRIKGIEGIDGGVIPIQVEDSIVYCPGGREFFAVNLYTGKKIWAFDYGSRSPGDHFGHGDFYINGNRILIKPSGDHLAVLNRFTGDEIHYLDNMGFTMQGRFTHFEGKLFYIADADLIIIDDYSGERLLPEDRQNHLGKLTENAIIDPVRRVMYLCNYHEALCVKLPDDL